jgi:hypothetical protein
VAYVFERTSRGWNQNETQILRASNAGRGDKFGWSVGIDGDRAIVGARDEAGPSNSKDDAGAAYVFERTASGWNQTESQILRASNAEELNQFGIVAIDGDRALVGARFEDGPSNNKPTAGAAYIKTLVTPRFTAGASSSLTVKENGNADLTRTLAVADKSSSDNLTWRVSSAPSGSLSGVDGESKTISGPDSPHTLSTSPTYAPDGYLDGSDRFTVQVSDGSATDEITVDVTVNGAPSISSFSDRTIRTGQSIDPIRITVSDPETAAERLALSAGADNATLVPESGLTVTEPDANGDASLEVEPASGETGTATVTVTVEDKEGQTASSSFELQVTSGTVSASVSRSFGDASGPGDYRLVALPGQVSQPLGQVVSGTAGQEWQAYRDDGSGSGFLVEYDGSDDFTFKPGTGFWLTSRETWTESDDFAAAKLKDGIAEIDLRDGWNVISNPLGKDVSWSAVEKQNVDTQNGESLQPLWGFDGAFAKASTFASATSGKAYYFFNDQGLSTLQIPYPSSSKSASDPKAKAQTGTPAEADSMLALTARLGTAASTVRIGFGDRNSKTAAVAAPPARFSAVSLRIEARQSTSEKAPGRTDLLMADSRAVEGRGTTVPLQLRSRAEGPVTLSAEHLEATGREAVALVNPSSGTSHDLRSKEAVQVRPSGKQALRLAVGTEQYVTQQKRAARPTEVTLTAYPNPVREQGTLEYTLPEAGTVSLRVYDVLGRRVATLASGRTEAGLHTATLPASRLSSGVYIARLRVGGTTVTQKITVVR